MLALFSLSQQTVAMCSAKAYKCQPSFSIPEKNIVKRRQAEPSANVTKFMP